MRRPAFVALPEKLARFEIDTSKARVRLVTAAEGIEMPLMIDGRGPMGFEREPAPDFFDCFAAGFHAQQDRANLVVSGGDENQIVHDDWGHRIDGVVKTRTE